MTNQSFTLPVQGTSGATSRTYTQYASTAWASGIYVETSPLSALSFLFIVIDPLETTYHGTRRLNPAASFLLSVILILGSPNTVILDGRYSTAPWIRRLSYATIVLAR